MPGWLVNKVRNGEYPMAAGRTEMRYSSLLSLVQASRLDIFAALHPADGSAPEGCQTLLLLGPHEPAFWRHVSQSREFRDRLPDPLERWSRRVIGALAQRVQAVAIFPSDGPPHPSFIAWALASGWIQRSPVGLLVHEKAGLWLSFRGALALPHYVELPAAPENPCARCNDQPCRTACPVDALHATHYDVAACRSWLDTDQRRACMTRGCAARRACPAGREYGRLTEQSAFHMKAFHPG